jgi:uncharacterized protein YdeI (YjbR/CyaY-like superfamily)
VGVPEPPETVEAADRAAWRRWLQRNHMRSTGVWLLIGKKDGTVPAVGYDDAVEEALCFGWIDSKPNTLDEHRYKLWMAPRKPKSVWSAINKARIERLLADGKVTPAGQAAIETAKTNGAWDALKASDALELPDDLLGAFDRHPGSRRNWDGFPPGVRRQILEWINAAKREQTRATRVEETASRAARNVRANQWRGPSG